jgi:hypothetical protein
MKTPTLAPVYLDNEPVSLMGDPRPQVSKVIAATGKHPEKFDVMLLHSENDTEGKRLGLDEVIDRTEEPTKAIYLTCVEKDQLEAGSAEGAEPASSSFSVLRGGQGTQTQARSAGQGSSFGSGTSGQGRSNQPGQSGTSGASNIPGASGGSNVGYGSAQTPQGKPAQQGKQGFGSTTQSKPIPAGGRSGPSGSASEEGEDWPVQGSGKDTGDAE